MKIIASLLILTLFIQCASTSDNDSGKMEILTDETTDSIQVSNLDDSLVEITNELDTNQDININDLPDYSHLPREIDELYLFFEGEGIEIETDLLRDLNVSVRSESSITVMDEGPHCDLDHWIHGYSDRKPLKHLEKYKLDEIGYTMFEFRRDYEEILDFPIQDMDIIREEVKENCGEFWSNHIATVKSPNEYPCAVGVSAYIFRVTGTDLVSGKEKTYFIRIPELMGC